MELNFVQSSEVFGKNTLAWETEFTVDKEFNLHLERVKGGEIMMMQRTSGTFFDVVEDFHMNKGDIIYDYDSAPFLGTKTIKIVSVSAIRFAAVTTDGEITEIKSQSKEVEVTANGTMDITPDAGFSYLNSVKVKTNVPTSGEGGNGGGNENTYEYIELTKPEGWVGDDFNGTIVTPLVMLCALLGKVEIDGNMVIVAPYLIGIQQLTPIAIAYDPNMVVQADTGPMKVSELLQMFDISDLPHLTKEQFYNLNA